MSDFIDRFRHWAKKSPLRAATVSFVIILVLSVVTGLMMDPEGLFARPVRRLLIVAVISLLGSIYIYVSERRSQ